MMEKTQGPSFSSVPCLGDDFYKDLLRTVAMKLGVSQSLLVRVALDELAGSHFQDAASFFGRSDGYIQHMKDEIKALNESPEAIG